jgi:hypothetical protein
MYVYYIILYYIIIGVWICKFVQKLVMFILTCGSASVLCAKLIFVLTVRSRKSCVGLELFPSGAFGCSTEPWDNFLKWYIWNNGETTVGLGCVSCIRVYYTGNCGTAVGNTPSDVPTRMANKRIKNLRVKSHVYCKRRSFSLI